MAAASVFRVPVSDLLAEPGLRREVEVATDVDWSLELSRVGPSLRVVVLLESAAGGLVATGQVDTTVTHTCHRCLVEWTDPLTVNLREVIGVGDDEDGYPLAGDLADLEPPVRDAVLLAVPLSPTCRDDCRGLCAVCGADLNTAPCSGHDEEPDSPFASLRGLLDT